MTDAGTTCDGCGQHVSSALSRTLRLTVDRAEIDVQRLCPDCFAGWIDRYQSEMQPDASGGGDEEIIVD
jgi:RNase P subunit RPR2